jgi:hypothetical protein
MNKEIKIASGIMLYAYSAALTSRFAFSSRERKTIEKRDNSQCSLCGSNDIIVSHHLIPECLENGNSYTDMESDSYVRSIYPLYEKILSEIPHDKKASFRNSIKIKIHSSDNGMALCKFCHTGLHQGKLNDEGLIIKFNKLNGNFPKSLDANSINEFFICKIILPALYEADLNFEMVTPLGVEPRFLG